MMDDRVVLMRCPSGKFGSAVNATGLYRVRCKGKFCKQGDLVVFHMFDLSSGELLGTDASPYRPPRELLGTMEEDPNALRRAAVRVS